MPNPFALHRNYRLTRTHIADIKEPAVQALWWYRYAQRTAEDVEPFSRDPEARERRDDQVEEVLYAMQRCNDIIAKERDARKLERHSERNAA